MICHDCRQSTAGRCWRHAQQTIRTGGASVIYSDHLDTGEYLMFARLDPEHDPIVRAICEKLGIDWRALMEPPK